MSQERRSTHFETLRPIKLPSAEASGNKIRFISSSWCDRRDFKCNHFLNRARDVACIAEDRLFGSAKWT